MMFIIALTVLFSGLTFAQTTVNVVSDLTNNTEGNLNKAIQTAITAGTLSKTTFMLEAYGYYILNGTINVPAGQTLTITAPDPGTTQATAPPQIVWSVSGGLNYQFNFDVYGNISLKNIWIMYATTIGDQTGSSLTIEEDPLATRQYGTFEGCIFDYAPCPGSQASGAVGVASTHFKGTFKNCYFKNDIDRHLRYYGRALSFPYNTTGWHSDSVSFENCTFANMGYVYMQEGGEYADFVKFNHCTFLDVVIFPLESGWWNKLAVTNCIFVNTNMFGDTPGLRTGDIYGGTLRIDSISTFGFAPIHPFTEQQRQILFTNSSYCIDPWLVTWMSTCPYSVTKHQNRQDDVIPIPMPMISPNTIRFFDTVNAATNTKLFPLMNRANLYDNANPGFITPPTDTAKLKVFMNKKWDDNSDTNWAWRPQNSINAVWPLVENLAYSNTTLKTAGMGGFPLGDLYHWWNPAYRPGATNYYTTWNAQKSTEDATIANRMANGGVGVKEVSNVIPSDYILNQNYPNPFNPTTQIEYSVPQKGFISLKVYNLLGQEVATLFNGVQNTGNYVATFDGAGLASGVYLYQLQSANVSITKKFVLMK
jgi:hypothetical protein